MILRKVEKGLVVFDKCETNENANGTLAFWISEVCEWDEYNLKCFLVDVDGTGIHRE